MRSANQPTEGGSTPTVLLYRSRWRVSPVSLSTTREMVVKHHYSRGGSNTAVYTFGVVPIAGGDSVAVSWWIPPTKTCGGSVWPRAPQSVLALSRLVCTPSAPKNTPSFLLAHSQRQIDRTRWPVLITFADKWQGHTGAIYKAAGWIACGMTKPERTYTKDGVMIARKAGPHTRTHNEMIALGCELVGSYSRYRWVHVLPALRAEFEPIRIRLVGGISAE